MSVHGAAIQILDLPGIIEGAKDGKGRGRQVIAGACLFSNSPVLTSAHIDIGSTSRTDVQSCIHRLGCAQTARRQGCSLLVSAN